MKDTVGEEELLQQISRKTRLLLSALRDENSDLILKTLDERQDLVDRFSRGDFIPESTQSTTRLRTEIREADRECTIRMDQFYHSLEREYHRARRDANAQNRKKSAALRYMQLPDRGGRLDRLK
ncbi:MAG: hypothetical protein ACQEQV_10065 [Fibrobacterota bacterium]